MIIYLEQIILFTMLLSQYPQQSTRQQYELKLSSVIHISLLFNEAIHQVKIKLIVKVTLKVNMVPPRMCILPSDRE